MSVGRSFKPPYVLLEDRTGQGRPARLYHSPLEVIRCDDPHRLDATFEAIGRGLARGLHAAGFFSYELGYALEPSLAARMPERRQAPLIWMGLFAAPRRIDARHLDARFAALPPPPPIAGLQPGFDRATHGRKMREILHRIAAGDVYQVNLTFPLRFRYAADPLRLYAALRARQPAAHGGVVALDEMSVLSVSPELWVETSGDRAVARPMKGTCARGRDPAADAAARRALAADPKQLAENLMIVDLLRNDLARLSAPGSVEVPELFTVETYPGFHALTSTITARLNAGHGLRERVAALFPCGSVVGAPKIKAGEIIRDLEAAPRGVYTGALGAIQPNGDMRFNVAIRTAVLHRDGLGCYGVGGGIVADSAPDAEYDEALLKGRVLTDLAAAYELIETFRWSWPAGFIRLGPHLARLATSARCLGFQFRRARIERALRRLAEFWTAATPDRRVRLSLARCGTVSLTHAAVLPAPPVLRLWIAPHRLDPGDPFLRHKTTRREAYETAFTEARARGLDEALFLNRRGEAADASRHTLFARLDGLLLTPPLSAGVLPGILRQALLSRGEARERSLTLPDLRRAERLWVGNSLHGLRPARLVD